MSIKVRLALLGLGIVSFFVILIGGLTGWIPMRPIGASERSRGTSSLELERIVREAERRGEALAAARQAAGQVRLPGQAPRAPALFSDAKDLVSEGGPLDRSLPGELGRLVVRLHSGGARPTLSVERVDASPDAPDELARGALGPGESLRFDVGGLPHAVTLVRAEEGRAWVRVGRDGDR